MSLLPLLHFDPTEVPTWHAFVDAWPLFRDPILCAAVAGAVLGFLSIYVVLRRMVFVSAAVTQAAGLGVALAFYAQIHLATHVDPLLGAAGLSLVATLLFSLDPSRLRVPRETILGLAFALAGAGAVLVGDRISQEAHDIQAILFGSAVLVSEQDLVAVSIVGGVVVALHVVGLRGIQFAIFDREAARVQGLPVRALGAFLFVSVGLMVGVSARALGSLPVFAFSVLPAAALLILEVPLPWAFVGAAALGALAGVLGYVFAFFRQFPVGGSQTLVAGAFVCAALVLRLTRRWLRRR